MGESPSPSALLLSVLCHAAVVALVLMLPPEGVVQFPPIKLQAAQKKAATIYLSSKAEPVQSKALTVPMHTNRNLRRERHEEQGIASLGTASEGLRAQAQQATAEITHSIRFHQVYGFYPGAQYQLAVQTAGQLPAISADEAPAHYQQYVVVEVTIDTTGTVAEARIVAGLVDSTIQQKLLSAIREFKYNPAKRDGIPIPSQRDIVVHVPS